MSYFYNITSIPVILNKFKVKNIVISGNLGDNLANIVLRYVEENNIHIHFIHLDKFMDGLFFDEFKKLHDYDAIFINDDPNWYTLFNELNLIKQNNEFFPLVFICHDMYPNKKRDAYINPNVIPEEFRIDYSQDFKFGKISLNDGLCHALNENTPKNGVSTAIEDFLSENSSIKFMDFCLDNGTKILYLDDEFTKPILKILKDNLTDYLSNENIEDIIGQNNFLSDYVSNLDDVQYQKSNNKDYLNKIKIQNYEINYKNSQITALESKLDFKDTQIKNFEIKLYNAQIDSNKNNEKINNLSDEVNSLRGVVSQRDESISDLSDEVNSLRGVVSQRDGNISDLSDEVNSLRGVVSQRDGNISDLSDEVNSLRGVVSQRDESISDLSDEVNSLRGVVSQRDESISDLSDEVNSLRGVVSQRDGNISDLSDEVNSLRGVVSQRDGNISDLSDEVNSLRGVVSQRDESISDLSDEVNSLRGVVSQRDESISDLSDEVNSLRGVVSQRDESISDLSDEVNSLRGVVSQRDESISDLSDEVNSLRGVVSQRDESISDLNNQIISLKTDNLEKNRIVGEIKNKLNRANNQITSLNEDLSLKEEIYNNGLFEFKNQINGFKMELNSLKETLGLVRENEIELSNQIIDGNQKISNKDVEISYLKNGAFFRMFLSPLAYFILIFKSGSKNILTNIKLYRKLKNSEYFDVGYYLNEYSDMSTNKWCKYFSPELHYVCVGLEEGRRCRKFCVNKSAEDLLNEIMNDN